MSISLCDWCGQPTRGLASIGRGHYCQEWPSPTCWELAQAADANGVDVERMPRLAATDLLGDLLAAQERQWDERHGEVSAR